MSPEPLSVLRLRPATPGDADLLARVIDMAGEGLPQAIWADMGGPDADPWEIGRERARRDSGGFSWRNAVVAERDGHAMGAIVTYLTEAEPVPPGPDTPPVFRPLIELEALAPATRYVNALAVLPAARRQGVAQALMDNALQAPGPAGLSLIVTDANASARALCRPRLCRKRPAAHRSGAVADLGPRLGADDPPGLSAARHRRSPLPSPPKASNARRLHRRGLGPGGTDIPARVHRLGSLP